MQSLEKLVIGLGSELRRKEAHLEIVEDERARLATRISQELGTSDRALSLHSLLVTMLIT